jgi:hypothetical protein
MNRCPKTDLPGVLVKEEHILDKGQSNRLSCRKGETHKRSHGIIDLKPVCQAAAQRAERPHESRPKQNWNTSPGVDERNPKDTAEAAI